MARRLLLLLVSFLVALVVGKGVAEHEYLREVSDHQWEVAALLLSIEFARWRQVSSRVRMILSSKVAA